MEVDVKCGLCKNGKEVEDVCGKLHYDNHKTAAHHRCMQYSAQLIQYKFQNFGGFKIDKVEEEIRRGSFLKCHICKNDKARKGKHTGATAGCAISTCRKTFHFYCAKLDPATLTKRLQVNFAKKNSTVVMYRVFCGENHYEEFKKNKETLQEQQQRMATDESDEEEGEEEIDDDYLPDTVNTQAEEDILMVSMLLPGKEHGPHSGKNSSKGQKESSSYNDLSDDEIDEDSDDVLDTTPALRKKKKGYETSPQKQRSSPPAAFTTNCIKNTTQNGDHGNNMSDPSEYNKAALSSSISKLRTTSERLTPLKSSKEEKSKVTSSNSNITLSPAKTTVNSLSQEKKKIGSKSVSSSPLSKSDKSILSSQVRKSLTTVMSGHLPNGRLALNKNRNSKDGSMITTQAELHITPTSSSASDENNCEDLATRNDQDDNEEIICSPVKGRRKVLRDDSEEFLEDEKLSDRILDSSITPIQHNTTPHNMTLSITESGSASEADDSIKFPDSALIISSNTTLSAAQRMGIIQSAKKAFNVKHVAFWTEFASKSVTDHYLPHLMKIVSDMVSEKLFKKLGYLLTEERTQDVQIESMKYLEGLPADIVNNLRESLLKKIYSKSLKGELIMKMDNKWNVLMLKLNESVDRVCKIRSHILPETEEFSGVMYEWTDKTVLALSIDDTDFQEEFKAINCWLNQKCKTNYQLTVLPLDDILTKELQNSTIQDLNTALQKNESNSSRNRVVLVQNLDDMIKFETYIQKLIKSLSSARTPVFIVTSIQTSQPCTKDKIVPTDLPAGTDVCVLSTHKPSKKAVSCIIITINMMSQQNAVSDATLQDEDFDEITPCEDPLSTSRLRKRQNSPATPSSQKRSRRT